MSWSISFIGKSDKVIAALQEQSNKLSGASKEEFDAVLPSLCTLVEKNVGETTLVKLEANGHAGVGYGQCTVSLSQIYGVLV